MITMQKVVITLKKPDDYNVEGCKYLQKQMNTMQKVCKYLQKQMNTMQKIVNTYKNR